MDFIKAKIRDVADFPKPGILFRDLTPVFSDGPTFKRLVDALAARYAKMPVDLFLAVESRGFLVGAPLAYATGKGLAIARKPGKLPWKVTRVTYDLEYGKDTLEMHQDAIPAGARVVVVDDLLATGGTSSAAVRLVERAGAKVVEAAFVVELTGLDGRRKLSGVPVHVLVQY